MLRFWSCTRVCIWLEKLVSVSLYISSAQACNDGYEALITDCCFWALSLLLFHLQPLAPLHFRWASEPPMASQASASTQSSSSSQSQAGSRRLSPKSLVQFNFTQAIRHQSDNYLVWKSQFLPAIRGHKLPGYLDGSPPCPELDPDDPARGEDVEHWQSQDEIIQQHMYSSITKEVRTQLVGCTTSHQSWRALEGLFASPSKSPEFFNCRFSCTVPKRQALRCPISSPEWRKNSQRGRSCRPSSLRKGANSSSPGRSGLRIWLGGL